MSTMVFRYWRRGSFLHLMLFAALAAMSSAAVAQEVDEDDTAPPDDVADPAEESKPGIQDGDKPINIGPDTAKGKPAPMSIVQREQNCSDRIDNDGDSVVDCGDADCFSQPVCRPSGEREQTDRLCSDWIDNDGDGLLDCDDPDCQTSGVTACQGFYKGSELAGEGKRKRPAYDLPSLDGGAQVDELIGKFGDQDGERNDYTCSDGVDNDGDGKVDCADYGCRFDPDVTVCNPSLGVRFGVYTQLEQSYRIEDTNAPELDQNDWDTRFAVLQLRALGPIGNIPDSFFLINLRAERTPRLTFALFQVPIGNLGHYFNINSGGGTITSQFIISRAKQPLLEPAFFVFNAFEEGNGAAAEIGGPIDAGGRVRFRAFAAGGSGRFNGNVGGRFFSDDNTNYTWASGAAFNFNILGYWGRFDNPRIYTPSNPLVHVSVGGKYDQRAQERYPAWNAQAIFRWWHFGLQAEHYGKQELEFGSTQYSYYVLLTALLWPKHLFASADFGEYIAGDLDNPPENLNTEVGDALRRQRDERQFRGGLTWYAYERTGLLTLTYTNRDVKDGRFAEDGFREQILKLIASYNF
ncbi:MAG: hypothetical protein AAGA56_07615 [Myxococcota bacterium]